MSVALVNLIKLYRFTGGRRQLAMSQVKDRATTMGLGDIAGACEQGIEHEKRLRDLQREYAVQKNRKMPARLQQLDPEIDRTLGAIYRIASEAAVALPPPMSEMAQRLTEELFPQGASGITTRPYAEQSHEVTSIIERMESASDFLPAVEALGLTAFVKQLKLLNTEFRQVFEAEPKDRISPHEVRAAEAEAQDNLLAIVVRILGQFPERSPAHVEARTKLLTPVLRQNEAIREYLRARRRVRDVDPSTGKELEAPEGDADVQFTQDANVSVTTSTEEKMS